MLTMTNLLKDWVPSEAALNLIKLNGVSDEQIEKSISFLKSKPELNDINDIEGYDDWNSFFIMFCVKVNNVDG